MQELVEVGNFMSECRSRIDESRTQLSSSINKEERERAKKSVLDYLTIIKSKRKWAEYTKSKCRIKNNLAEIVRDPRVQKWKTESNLNRTEEANWRFNTRKRGRDTIDDTIPHEFARGIFAPEYNSNFISSIFKKLNN